MVNELGRLVVYLLLEIRSEIEIVLSSAEYDEHAAGST